MKKILMIIFGLFLMLILTGCNKIEYDKKIGFKDYVTVTFKYGKNVQGKENEVYKVYGVQKGEKISYDDEPEPPTIYQKGDSITDVGNYYFKKDWNLYYVGDSYENARRINLSNYTFYKDETIYIDFYEGFQRRSFYIVKNNDVELFYAINVINGNTEIYSFFTLDSNTIVTDWGEHNLNNDPSFMGLEYYMNYFNCTNIIGWFYDKNCTKPISFPITPSRYNNYNFDYYLKVE